MTKANIWKKLSERLKTATRGSVRKWVRIVLSKGADEICDNCPLCQCTDCTCNDCPVGMQNGSGCGHSPYRKWAIHHADEHEPPGEFANIHKIECPRCLVLAKAELHFLAGFLPKSDKLQIQVAKALKTKWADIKGRKK